MRTRLLVVLAATSIIGSASSTPAYAVIGFCMEPKAPTTLFMTKPTKPYCATSGGCSQWEIDSYKRQVNTYFDSLKEYADGVDRYYKRAGEYIDCMSKLD